MDHPFHFAVVRGSPDPAHGPTEGLPRFPRMVGIGRGFPATLRFHFQECVGVAKYSMAKRKAMSGMILNSASTLPTRSPSWQSGKVLRVGEGEGSRRAWRSRITVSLASGVALAPRDRPPEATPLRQMAPWEPKIRTFSRRSRPTPPFLIVGGRGWPITKTFDIRAFLAFRQLHALARRVGTIWQTKDLAMRRKSASINHPSGNVAVGVDAAVAEEGPMATDFLQPLQVAGHDQVFLDLVIRALE